MDSALTYPKVSVVVPAFNAGSTLEELSQRLLKVLDETYSERFQLILVDDGSSDDTWKIIDKLAGSSNRIVGLRLSRNFGQTSALCAGIEVADGDVIATLDSDFDTFPEDIPKLVSAVISGAAVVNGTRSGRNWRRAIPSKFFNRRMRGLGLSYTDAGCGMIAMRREIALEALKHGEFRRGFRFKILLASLASEVVEVPVRAGPYSPSSHRITDLFSAAIETEVAVRRTVFLGLAAAGATIGVTGAIAAILSLVMALGSGGSTAWMVAAWGSLVGLLGGLICFVAIAANLVLRSAFHQGTPFFEVGTMLNGPDQLD